MRSSRAAVGVRGLRQLRAAHQSSVSILKVLGPRFHALMPSGACHGFPVAFSLLLIPSIHGFRPPRRLLRVGVSLL